MTTGQKQKKSGHSSLKKIVREWIVKINLDPKDHGESADVVDVAQRRGLIKNLFDMRLTKKNYFTLENQYISSSKLKDFAKSKEYFYNKHVRGSVERKVTPAMTLGSMVDVYVTAGPKKMGDLYHVVARRDLKNPPTGYTEVTQSVWDEALAIGKKVRASAAFKELKGYRKQVLLKVDEPIGRFPGMCGVLDFLMVNGSEATIVDLKTSSTIDPKRYFWQCMDYGYDIQMEFYNNLVRKKYPEVQTVRCLHLVVEKDPDKIHRIATFHFSTHLLNDARIKVEKLLCELASETKFKDEPVTFADCHTIGGAWEENVSVTLPE